MKAGIATQRATAGLLNELIDAAFDHHDETHSWVGVQQVLETTLQDRAIARYEPKIRAMFERAGITLPEGELNSAAMAQVIGDQLGVQIGELSVSSVRNALDAALSKQVSAELGVNLQSVLTVGVKQAVENAVSEAIASGHGLGLLDRGMVSRARKFAAFKGAGYVEKEEQRKVMARLYQKRYRRRNKLVWD